MVFAPAQVAKAPKDPDAAHSYTTIPKPGMAAFLAEHASEGAVVGGTAWDFSNTQRVDRDGLDLLVIDEAGQFSLASTIAVAAGAKRLCSSAIRSSFQQVSQGAHPEPVDASALGWGDGWRPGRAAGSTATSSRAPGGCIPSSRHRYPRWPTRDSWRQPPGTELRAVQGIEPGLHVIPLRHRGNSTQSPEEAAEVVRLVRDLVGRSFTDNDESRSTRPLVPADIIVVTPYNAQRQLVLDALATAGYHDVPVGTVDNFQGKEAVVSITSLAASSGRDAPRGPEFLLLQNRLNVAISARRLSPT